MPQGPFETRMARRSSTGTLRSGGRLDRAPSCGVIIQSWCMTVGGAKAECPRALIRVFDLDPDGYKVELIGLRTME